MFSQLSVDVILTNPVYYYTGHDKWTRHAIMWRMCSEDRNEEKKSAWTSVPFFYYILDITISAIYQL